MMFKTSGYLVRILWKALCKSTRFPQISGTGVSQKWRLGVPVGGHYLIKQLIQDLNKLKQQYFFAEAKA